MKEKVHIKLLAEHHYWSNNLSLDTTTLCIFTRADLLTIDYLINRLSTWMENIILVVWDAPAHASSWPFRFEFDLFDKAKWLNGILEKEEIIKPIIIGQSMGGYVGQAYAQLYPDRLAGSGRFYFH